MSCRTRSGRFEKRDRDSSELFILPKKGPMCRRTPLWKGGQFSQRPRLCDDFSRQMLLNHGFSAAAGSVCRLFTAAASANRLFAKTAFVRPLHRGCFYTPVFHSGRLRAPVLHRTWFCTPACLPFRRSRSVSGAGIKENGAARAGCTVSCIGVAEASLRRKRVTGESVLRRSTDSLFCCD